MNSQLSDQQLLSKKLSDQQNQAELLDKKLLDQQNQEGSINQ